MSAPPQSLGGRLREARLRAGLTQDALATLAGVHRASVQMAENGRSARPRKLDAIAAALDVSPAWLAFGDDLTPDARALALAWDRLSKCDQIQARDFILHLGRT